MLGREVQLAPASRKKGSLFFTFSFWCQGKGPAAGPAPGYHRSRLLASPTVFSSSSHSFQPLLVMGLCPAWRENPPRHFNQWERPPHKACMANSSAIPPTYIPDPVTALPPAANFALLYLQDRHAALQRSLLKVSLQSRLTLPESFFFKMVF